MFLQDHRENGQLQPDHPGDSTSLRAPGGVEGLHSQSAVPIKLHQCGCHPAGEERPASANTATGFPWRADNYDTLHKLVCALYCVGACKGPFKTRVQIYIASFRYCNPNIYCKRAQETLMMFLSLPCFLSLSLIFSLSN